MIFPWRFVILRGQFVGRMTFRSKSTPKLPSAKGTSMVGRGLLFSVFGGATALVLFANLFPNQLFQLLKPTLDSMTECDITCQDITGWVSLGRLKVEGLQIKIKSSATAGTSTKGTAADKSLTTSFPANYDSKMYVKELLLEFTSGVLLGKWKRVDATGVTGRFHPTDVICDRSKSSTDSSTATLSVDDFVIENCNVKQANIRLYGITEEPKPTADKVESIKGHLTPALYQYLKRIGDIIDIHQSNQKNRDRNRNSTFSRPPPTPEELLIHVHAFSCKNLSLGDSCSSDILQRGYCEGHVDRQTTSSTTSLSSPLVAGQFWIRRSPLSDNTHHEWHFERVSFQFIRRLLGLGGVNRSTSDKRFKLPVDWWQGNFDLHVDTMTPHAVSSIFAEGSPFTLNCSARLHGAQVQVPDHVILPEMRAIGSSVATAINRQLAGKEYALTYSIYVDRDMVSSWKKGALLDVTEILVSQMINTIVKNSSVDKYLASYATAQQQFTKIVAEVEKQFKELAQTSEEFRAVAEDMKGFYQGIWEETYSSVKQRIPKDVDSVLNIIENYVKGQGRGSPPQGQPRQPS